MNQSDKQAFGKMVTDVLAYYSKDASDFTLNVWWTACQSFEMEEVGKALTAHATDAERGVYAPKVADMVRVLSGTTTDRAMLAWGKVLEALSSVGAYSDVVFDDPAIHAAIEDCGGWVKTCRSDIAELSYLQHRFCQSHKAYTGRGKFEYQRRLMGDRGSDDDFRKIGLKPPKPAVVGNIELARIVYSGGQVGGKTAIAFTAIENIVPEVLIGHTAC